MLTTPERVEVNARWAPMHVVVEPADQGAGLGPGEELQRHPLHVVIDPGAEVEDDALADAGRIPPLGEREQRVGDGQPGDDQSEPDDGGAGVEPPLVMALMTSPASTGVATPMMAEITTVTRKTTMSRR